MSACEEGAANVTVSSIIERSQVSRRTFYELFDGVQDCLLATIDDAIAQAHDRVLEAWSQDGSPWRTRVRAGMTALLEFFDQQPQLARLLVVEWPAAGAEALERRSRLCRQLACVIDQGREEMKGDRREAPPLIAEGLVGAVASILQAWLLEPAPEGRMSDLLNPLMSMIVLPYRGAAAARRELAEEVSPSVAEAGGSAGELVERLGVRITYRTVLVLRAIAAHPGASNRRIAQEAGVADQGQISKLLRRLERAGLVENPIGEDARGAPNAWTLTAKGERVERSLRA
jgi:AcrR family transcriptional regulator